VGFSCIYQISLLAFIEGNWVDGGSVSSMPLYTFWIFSY
jgi:hypothetical protein